MIRQFVTEDACLTCHGCCRFLQKHSVWGARLLDEEIDGLLQHGLPPSLLTADKELRLVNFAKENILVCSLFNPQENKCKIYEHRPFECRLYPFLLNRKGPKIFLAVDLKCPHIQKNLKNKEFNEYVKYLTGLLKSPHYRELFKNNPHIIQKYAGVLDLNEI